MSTDREAFEKWVTSTDCPIPAGTAWTDEGVQAARAAWQAAQDAPDVKDSLTTDTASTAAQDGDAQDKVAA